VDRAQQRPQLGGGPSPSRSLVSCPLCGLITKVVEAAHAAVRTEDVLDRVPVASMEAVQVAPQPGRPVLLADTFESSDRLASN
jgi:hypothetical protein